MVLPSSSSRASLDGNGISRAAAWRTSPRGRHAVNKGQLVDALESRLGSKRAAAEALEAVVDVITVTVAKGEKVAITGFGTFEKAARAARTGRNPRTGQAVKIKKTSVPRFRAGTAFKEVTSDAKALRAFTAAAAGRAASATGKVAASVAGTATSTARRATGTAAPAKKTAAKKTAKAAPAKKAAAKKTAKAAPAKKATAKKPPRRRRRRRRRRPRRPPPRRRRRRRRPRRRPPPRRRRRRRRPRRRPPPRRRRRRRRPRRRPRPRRRRPRRRPPSARAARADPSTTGRGPAPSMRVSARFLEMMGA